jgi:hypothetical protein
MFPKALSFADEVIVALSGPRHGGFGHNVKTLIEYVFSAPGNERTAGCARTAKVCTISKPFPTHFKGALLRNDERTGRVIVQ